MFQSRLEITVVSEITEQHRRYQSLWFYGPENKVIVHCENGKWVAKPWERFQLDLKTGLLTISSLVTISDSSPSVKTSHHKNLTWQLRVSNTKEVHSLKEFDVTVILLQLVHFISD